MTAVGLAVVRICLDQVSDPKVKEALEAALDDGWAWMQQHFAVASNPGAQAPPWAHYYYLYGLERAGVFCGYRQVGDHDWYVEGAEYLLAQQAESGAWRAGQEGSDADTCFAILFLKRASTGFVHGYAVGPAR